MNPKYTSPGTILPLQTSSYVDLKMSVIFGPAKTDLPMSAIFTSSAAANTVKILTGTASAVVIGATATVVQFVVLREGSLLYGLECSGETDGTYFIQINSQNIALINPNVSMRFMTNITNPNIAYQFPVPIPISVGTTVSIQVTNDGIATSNYTAALFGDF